MKMYIYHYYWKESDKSDWHFKEDYIYIKWICFDKLLDHTTDFESMFSASNKISITTVSISLNKHTEFISESLHQNEDSVEELTSALDSLNLFEDKKPSTVLRIIAMLSKLKEQLMNLKNVALTDMPIECLDPDFIQSLCTDYILRYFSTVKKNFGVSITIPNAKIYVIHQTSPDRFKITNKI